MRDETQTKAELRQQIEQLARDVSSLKKSNDLLRAAATRHEAARVGAEARLKELSARRPRCDCETCSAEQNAPRPGAAICPTCSVAQTRVAGNAPTLSTPDGSIQVLPQNAPQGEALPATVETALAATLAAMRNLRRVAFVGSHVPRVRDPLVIEADEADRLATAALAGLRAAADKPTLRNLGGEPRKNAGGAAEADAHGTAALAPSTAAQSTNAEPRRACGDLPIAPVARPTRCAAEWPPLADVAIRCELRFGHDGQHHATTVDSVFIWPNETARA